MPALLFIECACILKKKHYRIKKVLVMVVNMICATKEAFEGDED